MTAFLESLKKRRQGSIAEKFVRKGYRSLKYQVCSRVGTLPDFIIIGAQKCGTTSLYNYLIQHPYIYPASRKEIGFFNLHFSKGLRWYRSNFPSSIKKYWIRGFRRRGFNTGEATTGYIASSQAICRIAQVLPKVKLILLLRNPVDRAYSHYQHAVRLGREILPFEEAIQTEEQRLGKTWQQLWQGQDKYILEVQRYSYFRLGIYADQVQVLLDTCPREQLLILNSAELYTDPSSAFKRTQRFLDVPLWELRQYDRFNSGSYKQMAPSTRRWLTELYRPHNERLYKLLGLDFGWEDGHRAGPMILDQSKPTK